MSKNISNLICHYLEPTLGQAKKSYGQVKFNCPSCDSGNKYNLEINVNESSTKYLKANCWSCHLKGLRNILKQYACDDSWKTIPEFKYTGGKTFSKKTEVEENAIELPSGVRSFEFSDELTEYLIKDRKCSLNELRKRKVKYVFDKEDTLYNNLIFPFFDENGVLVCFTSQNLTTKKYKNHGSTKIIAYKEFLNPYFPIIITEGIYDSLSVPNAIPLLGTMLNKPLLTFCQGKDIILALDNNKEVPEKYKLELEKELYKFGAKKVVIYDIGEYKDLNEYYILNEKQLKSDLREIYTYLLNIKEYEKT